MQAVVQISVTSDSMVKCSNQVQGKWENKEEKEKILLL